jgi:hypothetical protein
MVFGRACLLLLTLSLKLATNERNNVPLDRFEADMETVRR